MSVISTLLCGQQIPRTAPMHEIESFFGFIQTSFIDEIHRAFWHILHQNILCHCKKTTKSKHNPPPTVSPIYSIISCHCCQRPTHQICQQKPQSDARFVETHYAASIFCRRDLREVCYIRHGRHRHGHSHRNPPQYHAPQVRTEHQHDGRTGEGEVGPSNGRPTSQSVANGSAGGGPHDPAHVHGGNHRLHFRRREVEVPGQRGEGERHDS
mmetsp:Transcript_1318/g.2689  ORF Transcript_1318/g.2689 Transcript_1318/m.2689 type:complete len:211 (+) Transcript_1318:1615-2247(+)